MVRTYKPVGGGRVKKYTKDDLRAALERIKAGENFPFRCGPTCP